MESAGRGEKVGGEERKNVMLTRGLKRVKGVGGGKKKKRETRGMVEEFTKP